MKNINISDMKITEKLKVSFKAILKLMVIVCAIGVLGMLVLSFSNRSMYNNNVMAIVDVGHMEASFFETRVQIRNFIMYDSDSPTYASAVNTLRSAEEEFLKYMKDYEKVVNSSTERTKLEVIRNTFAQWQNFTSQMHSLTSAGNVDDARALLNSTGASLNDSLSATIKEVVAYNETAARSSLNTNLIIFIALAILQVAILAYSVQDSNKIANRVSVNISAPLELLSGFMSRAGSTGDIARNKEEEEALHKFGEAKDEIGQIITSTDSFMGHINHIAAELELLAGGDLTTDIEIMSDSDIMGQSVKHLADNLNNVFQDLNASSAQVSLGSNQIAEAAMNLAEGATSQAMSVKHLSETMSVIADKTKDNAEIADKTANHAGLIQSKAEQGSRQMENMIDAVKDINEASKAISEVIKTISGIASKTNILSLNAAVEAARAGEHGKGFAVVADEVRKLAAQSTEAVHHTTSLIQNSIDKADLGNSIALETSESLIEIVNLIKESTEFINDIAKLSDEQSTSIVQINAEIDQVLEVVENNSATSEESAAFSEEMSAQANVLEEMVAEFKLRNADHVRSKLK
ncbi:MAG: methyl-accepting chemotaxis protein [Lachnospiraceae bacterium]|nr:methyl-accepting chemotaxis protein [Lachnospiraceae bacterium]